MSERSVWKIVLGFVAGTLFGVFLMVVGRPPHLDYQMRVPIGFRVRYEVDTASLMRGDQFNSYFGNTVYTFTNRTNRPLCLAFPPIAVFKEQNANHEIALLPYSEGVPTACREKRVITILPGEDLSLRGGLLLGTRNLSTSGPWRIWLVFGQSSNQSEAPQYVGTLIGDVSLKTDVPVQQPHATDEKEQGVPVQRPFTTEEKEQ